MEQSSSSRIPNDKLSELRSAIDKHLRTQGVYSQIRSILASELLQEGDHSKEKILSLLQEKGVLSQLLSSVQASSQSSTLSEPLFRADSRHAFAPSNIQARLRHDQYYLHIHLVGGRAFTHEFVQEAGGKQKFTVHFRFGSQRFQSNPVGVAVDPSFDEQFLVQLCGVSEHPVNVKDLLHVVVTKHSDDLTLAGRTQEFVGSHLLDWRRVLKSGASSIAVELASSDPDMQLPSGILHLRLEILPKLRENHVMSEEELQNRLEQELSVESAAERDLLVYAKHWWKAYPHKNRLVRLFAPSESGHSRPVCAYVRPLITDRLLETPRQSSRFVSLIPMQKETQLGAGQAEIWFSQHAFLSRSRGDTANHALLLCSLLLGFGLDAWVCSGTTSTHKGGHLWVLTRSISEISFWEPSSGAKITLSSGDTRPFSVYLTIDSVFNDTQLFANLSQDNSVRHAVFSFESAGERWMKFAPPAGLLPIQPHRSLVCPLMPPTINVVPSEEMIEAEMRRLIVQFRENEGIPLPSTSDLLFDSQLAYMLSSALSSYELEKLTGIPTSSSDFSAAVQHTVPDGYSFKGFPMQFSHIIPSKMFHILVQSQVGNDVIRSRGTDVRFGVRTRVFVYPENVVATWLMVAVMYKP
eukprot:ANDGO_00990.mRNA.1 Centrosomal protein of 76 kDa OS=Danio rerio GN=cep76 PE=2 SV=1